MSENASYMQWKGSESQKFRIGERIHFARKDQLGTNNEAPDSTFAARRHYDVEFSDEYNYKPLIRVCSTKNAESHPCTDPQEKLVYIPPQRKAKYSQINISQKNDERNRFSRQIGMMTFKLSSKEQQSVQKEVDGKQQTNGGSMKVLKLTNKQREKNQMQLEDKNTVEYLDQWEEQRKDPNFYLKQRNQSTKAWSKNY